MAAARWPPRSGPVNSQFFLPNAMGGIFHRIVVDRQMATLCVANQTGPTFQGVIQGFGGSAAVRGANAGFVNQSCMVSRTGRLFSARNG